MPEPEIDIETLRRPRRERFTRWLSQLRSEITHRGWKTVDATVVECNPVREFGDLSQPIHLGEIPLLTGYVVSFSYEVNDRVYTGLLVSAVALEPKDKFRIRYNPANPRENNSLGSEGDFGTRIATLGTSLLALMALAALVRHFLLR